MVQEKKTWSRFSEVLNIKKKKKKIKLLRFDLVPFH